MTFLKVLLHDKTKKLFKFLSHLIKYEIPDFDRLSVASPGFVLKSRSQVRDSSALTRRLSGFEILNIATLIFQKWLVSRHFANTICIFHYLNFSKTYL